jgi:5-oxoprolinase (ATP-hydrolysing)/N-methylhydantoinase A
MIDSIELNSIRRGFDPRDFALVAFGGAGPLFAPGIARELELPTVVVPRFPGIASAIGLLESDVVHADSVSLVSPLRAIPRDQLLRRYEQLEAGAGAKLRADGFSAETMRIERYAECRYVGQGYELRVVATGGPIDDAWLAELESAFHEIHEREYAHSFRGSSVELVNIGVQGIGQLGGVQFAELAAGASPPALGVRPVWFEDGAAWREADVYARDGLPAGARIDGPAIVEQEDSTVVIPPGYQATVDAVGTMVIRSEATA